MRTQQCEQRASGKYELLSMNLYEIVKEFRHIHNRGQGICMNVIHSTRTEFLGKAPQCVLNMLVNKTNINQVYTKLCL